MLMGLTLGLVGAGGSILAVPILVFMFNVKPVVATGYSLLIVGCSALVGAISYWKSGLVHFKKAITFAIPAMFSILCTRGFILPAIPEIVFGFKKDGVILILFSGVMFGAAISMLKGSKVDLTSTNTDKSTNNNLLLGSLMVGFITGLVGAGGGFLIIPSLIAIFSFNIKEAIGTSLLVITINSLVGFNGDLARGLQIDWTLLAVFLLMTITGVLIGTTIGKKINAKHIKKIFATFILVLSIIILFKVIIWGV